MVSGWSKMKRKIASTATKPLTKSTPYIPTSDLGIWQTEKRATRENQEDLNSTKPYHKKSNFTKKAKSKLHPVSKTLKLAAIITHLSIFITRSVKIDDALCLRIINKILLLLIIIRWIIRMLLLTWLGQADHEFDFLLLSLVVIVGGQFRRVMTARGFTVAIRARRRRGVYGFLLFERGPAFLLLRDEQYFWRTIRIQF